MSPGKAHSRYAAQKNLQHTQTHKYIDILSAPRASNQGHQVPGFKVFGDSWVIFWSMWVFLSTRPVPRGNEGMISTLSSTHHSQRKQTGGFYNLLVDLQRGATTGY